MTNYLVKFTPLEPYFFGGDRTFSFGEGIEQKQGKYYIQSREIPTQSSIFGALRYALLPVVKHDFSYASEEINENENAIGRNSFAIFDTKGEICTSAKSYGKIQSISPIFIVNENDYFVKTPFDHMNIKANTKYAPYLRYETIETSLGNKYIVSDFTAKNGITESYVNLSTKEIVSDLFSTHVKTGISKKLDENGFFKKEYKCLKDGYSFAIFAELDMDDPKDIVICMGQGKSAFSVSFLETEDDLNMKINGLFANHPITKFVYAISDVFVDSTVYDSCQFAITKAKEYKNLITNTSSKSNFYSRLNKCEVLIRLIEAGSFFILSDETEFKNKIENDRCKQIGLNHIFWRR